MDVLLLIPLPLFTHPVPLTPLLLWNETVGSQRGCVECCFSVTPDLVTCVYTVESGQALFFLAVFLLSANHLKLHYFILDCSVLF